MDIIQHLLRLIIMGQYVLGSPYMDAVQSSVRALQKPDLPTAVSGNPFTPGWFADPDTAIWNDLYWVFATYSAPYEEQTHLNAFSSPDLINWTKHTPLQNSNIPWVKKALWAPAPIQRNGKYFCYFAGNDIQEDEDKAGAIGGIGVGVADTPEGPYLDPLGGPMIPHYHNGAQPIDQGIFLDDDGQAYMYYGGHGHANVVKVNEDMISLGTFEDGTQFKEITPENYVEGSLMIKRKGVYYYMWSEGGWTGPDYAVSYAMSDSPIGPFPRKGKILQQDSAVATGSGHHGVINVPGTDIWYIVYHRRPLNETDANHRTLSFDRMYFNDDGTIVPVKMLVQDNFASGLSFNWDQSGGDWSVVDKRLTVATTSAAVATLITNFTDLVYDGTVEFDTTDGEQGEAGLVFRVSKPKADGTFTGFFAGLTSTGGTVLSYHKGSETIALGNSTSSVSTSGKHHLRVVAIGSVVSLFVDDMDKAQLTVNVDGAATSGRTGVRVAGAGARFGDIEVKRPDENQSAPTSSQVTRVSVRWSRHVTSFLGLNSE